MEMGFQKNIQYLPRKDVTGVKTRSDQSCSDRTATIITWTRHSSDNSRYTRYSPHFFTCNLRAFYTTHFIYLRDFKHLTGSKNGSSVTCSTQSSVYRLLVKISARIRNEFSEITELCTSMFKWFLKVDLKLTKQLIDLLSTVPLVVTVSPLVTLKSHDMMGLKIDIQQMWLI